ncbi:MAG: hypothetical protein HYV27_05855 [Candidatus Hydrogenedentes bacterium]|nr:hypothetical protein [Candidatus Hydrogenedentota bacterium]
MTHKNLLLAAALASVTMLSGLAHAGAITGKIVFEGEAPPMKPVNTEGADPVCAAMHKDEPLLNEVLVLGEGQTMANVFVHVTGGLAAKDYPMPAEAFPVTQKGCRYDPHVFAVRTGQTVKILNPDGTLHNVNGMPEKNPPFNKGMPKNVTEMDVVFTIPEMMFPMRCDVHPWMRAYCAVMDHPFYTITQKDGIFKIDGLDAGEYEIAAWHERLGEQKAKVTVAADGSVEQNFTFKRN